MKPLCDCCGAVEGIVDMENVPVLYRAFAKSIKVGKRMCSYCMQRTANYMIEKIVIAANTVNKTEVAVASEG